MNSILENLSNSAALTMEFAGKLLTDIKVDVIATFEDIKRELTQDKDAVAETTAYLKATAISFIHIPYLPSFHSPGWLLRYIVGPYNGAWLESFISDFGAGLIVGLLLIPQVINFSTAELFSYKCDTCEGTILYPTPKFATNKWSVHFYPSW